MDSEWVFASIADVTLTELPTHTRGDGELVVLELGKGLPFAAVRVFTVRAAEGAVRGRHAHKRCAQLLVCVHGAIEVACDDGEATKTYVLDQGSLGLLVPSTIWATETYVKAGSVLAVLCSHPYEEDDYIRDYAEFRTWRTRAPHG